MVSALLIFTGCEEPVEDPLEEEIQEEEAVEEEIDIPENDREAIEAVVQQNLEATENEDARMFASKTMKQKLTFNRQPGQ